MIMDSKFEPEKLMIKARAVRTGNGNLTPVSYTHLTLPTSDLV